MSNLSQFPSLPTMSYAQVRHALVERQEIAIIDLREEHIFAQAHPLFSTNISLSRLDVEIFNRVPRLDTTVVIYDDGEGLVQRAYPRLVAYGYTQVYVLEGGLKGWQQAGGELFIDVNSASKAFGEWVEYFKHTPSLSAEEVKAKIEQNENIIIVDARRFDEYNTMNIPTGISVPGAELVLRAPQLVKDENTTIIVNCAGRTRSIIGTQSLINAQTPHQIYALRNGTIGWTLAEQQLEKGQQRRYEDFLNIDQIDTAVVQRAAALAHKAGVKVINQAQLDALQAESSRSTYLIDVRSAAEYQAGHYPKARWVAGGQLVQETDHYVGTRGGRVVLFDHHLARAFMSASWLAQMNWETYVFEDDFAKFFTEQGEWQPTLPSLKDQLSFLDADTLAAHLATEPTLILDINTLALYRKGHLKGAHWLLKSDIARIPTLFDLNQYTQIVLTCGGGCLAQYAAEDLTQLTTTPVVVLKGGNHAWLHAGYQLDQSSSSILSEEIDRYKRPYEGTDNSKEAMQAYLDWEFGLVDQLKKDNTHGFFVV